MFALGLMVATLSLLALSFSDLFSKTVTNAFGAYVGSLYIGAAIIPMVIYLLLFPPSQIMMLLLVLVTPSPN